MSRKPENRDGSRVLIRQNEPAGLVGYLEQRFRWGGDCNSLRGIGNRLRSRPPRSRRAPPCGCS